MRAFILVFSLLAATSRLWAADLMAPDVFVARELWAKIGAENVRSLTYQGRPINGQGVMVAVVDTGLSVFHPELRGVVASNIFEGTIANNFDDDLNGKVDDFWGWNFKDGSNVIYDEAGHGTHVAGIIAAKSFGIAPAAKILSLKVNIDTTAVDPYKIIEAVNYAIARGAKVINLSLRMLGSSIIYQEALKRLAIKAAQKDVLIIAAAGNDGLDITGMEILPANLPVENLITVCSVDQNFFLSSFSNFSSQSVHLCASGEDVMSLSNLFNLSAGESGYVAMSGTSMAAPMVTAAVALIWSMIPTLSASAVKNYILQGALAHQQSWLGQASTTHGTLNIQESINLVKRDSGVWW